MAKRNCRLEIRLTKDEYSDLTKKARKAGMTVSAFIRHAAAGLIVQERPSVDVPVLIREVRRIGINIDQILKLARTNGFIDVPLLRKALDDNRAMEKLIEEVYS